MAGRFVVLEGMDGAGTTTQRAVLAERLEARGLTVRRTAEPTDGPVGRLIRATLRGDEGAPPRGTLPWLFAADRSWHLQGLVEPSLEAGDWVLSDRYLPSSLAYQSLDWPIEQVAALNAFFRVPDLTVFLTLPVDVSLERIGRRGAARDIFEHREALERVGERYEAALARLGAEGWPIHRVDAAAPIEAVTEAIWAGVAPLLP